MSGNTNISVPVVIENKDALSTIQETVQTNWQTHRVAILAGTALVAGGLAIALTGGLAALPVAIGIGLVASGVLGGAGGLAFAAYYASRPLPQAEEITEKATQDDTPVVDEKPLESPPYLRATPPPGGFLPYDDEPAYEPKPHDRTPPRNCQENLNEIQLPVLQENNALDVAAFCAETKKNAVWTNPMSPSIAAAPQASSPQASTGVLVKHLMPQLSKQDFTPPPASPVSFEKAEEKEASAPKDALAKPLVKEPISAPQQEEAPISNEVVQKKSTPTYAEIAAKPKEEPPAAAPTPVKTQTPVATPVLNKPQATPSSAPQNGNDDGWFTIANGKKRKDLTPTPALSVPSENEASASNDALTKPLVDEPIAAPQQPSQIKVIYQGGHIQPEATTNNNEPEGENPIQRGTPSLSSYLPSARSVVKATAYLTGAVATAATAYIGYHVAQELMKDECPASDATHRSLGEHAAQRLLEIGGNVATSVADALASGEVVDQGECSVFDHTHKTYAEYYGGKLMGAGDLLQQGLSSAATSLNPFPTPSNISLLPLGTDTTNRTIASDSEPGLIDAASSLLARALESPLIADFQDCAEGVKDYFNPGMNVTASDVVKCCPLTSGITLPQIPLPSSRLAFAGGAALLTTGLALREPGLSVVEKDEEEVQDVAESSRPKLVKRSITQLKNDEISEDMKLFPDDGVVTTEEKKETIVSSGSQIARTRNLVGLAFVGTAAIIGAYRWSQMSPEERELFQNQATTFAASAWNRVTNLSDTTGKSIENWVNDTTWGDTAESWTQWAANTDPLGALGGWANSAWEAFVPASQPYQQAFALNETTCPSMLDIPAQSILEEATCPNIQISPVDAFRTHEALIERASIDALEKAWTAAKDAKALEALAANLLKGHTNIARVES